VPIGTPTMAAISLYEQPSISRNIIASRNSSFRSAMQARTRAASARSIAAASGLTGSATTAPLGLEFLRASRQSFTRHQFITGIANDLQQPRTAVVAAQRTEEAERPQIGFLDCLLGERIVAYQAARQAVGGVQVNRSRSAGSRIAGLPD
jgi:hypothetical protein